MSTDRWTPQSTAKTSRGKASQAQHRGMTGILFAIDLKEMDS